MNPLHSVQLIGAACGLGAPDIRCAEGPERMRTRLTAHGKLHGNLSWRETVRAIPGPGHSKRFQFSELLLFDLHLAHTVHDTVAEGSRFIVIGGDHSCAVGTWQGAARALAARGALGLIWIDAHMDAHTPRTSRTGNRHGMPLAALLGSSAGVVFQIEGSHATLAPQHVCLIGVRSFEPEEQQLLAQRGVRIFSMDEVRARGLMPVLRDALALVQKDTAAFGVTVDLDAIDPVDAPAVTTPVAAGIRASELIAAIDLIAQQHNLIGAEIAEYNPHNDNANHTGELVEQLID
ncbi:MAG TPA: arginase, partial [Spongiibacteraceae bacterium]|nr:arginase [Spongiibacteraceae bacterium]